MEINGLEYFFYDFCIILDENFIKFINFDEKLVEFMIFDENL